MTTYLTDIPVDEIRALADERARYEGWISALEARRGQTPPQVYDRVRGDYDGRLRRVLERLGAHVGGLQSGESRLAGRDDELAQSLADRQDELAEIELRTLVGEFAEDVGSQLRDEKAGEVRGLEEERAQVASDLTTVRELLVRATPPGEGDGPAPAGARDATPAVGAVARPQSGATAAAAGSSPAPAPREPRAGDQIADTHGPTYRGDVAAGHHNAPRAAAGPELETAPTATPTGAPAGGAGAAPAWRPRTPDAGTSAVRDATTPPPAPTPAPAAFSAAGMPEPEKTLRCQECSAMNYPTEWYCERCGGELAAL